MDMAKKAVEDCYYNVHKQLIKRLQFLWNVESYIKDSKRNGHAKCVKMWQEVAKNELKSVKLLQESVKSHNR